MVASLEQAKAFVDSIIPNVQELFEKDGFITPVSFIGAQTGPNGEPFPDVSVIIVTPEMMGVSMKDSAGTQQYTTGLRIISKACKAIMVVNVMEAWRVNLPREERNKLPKGSLEHVPGREEYIQVMMEHHKLGVTKVMMWSAKITRDEQERGILSEFSGPDTIEGSGRFLGMVEAPS